MEPANKNTLNSIEEVVKKIGDVYPFLDKKEYNIFMSKAAVILKDKNLDNIEKIKNILSFLNNPHAGIYHGEELTLPMEWCHGKIHAEKPFFDVIDNVMYLKIPSLLDINYKDLEGPFLKYKDIADGLVIDMRYNGGGQEFPARTFITQYLSKSGDHLMGVNMTRDVALSLNKDEIYVRGGENPYEKPIVVLVNECTFSSAERFVAIIKASTDCIIIGTKTRGGSGNPKEFLINENDRKYYIMIPTWRFFLPDEERPLEETKIKPDIEYFKEDIVDFAVNYIKNEITP